MGLDIYSSLLEELGQLMEIPLKPDNQNSCLIHFPDEIEIQLELDQGGGGEFLIIGSNIGEIPPGRYREDIFTAALKNNHSEAPRYGSFGWAQSKEKLVLFHMMPVKEIKGVHVAEFLIPFIEKVKKWRDALKNNEVPQVAGEITSTAGGGLFGLTP